MVLQSVFELLAYNMCVKHKFANKNIFALKVAIHLTG